MFAREDFLLDKVQRKEWHHEAPKGKRNVAGGVLDGYAPVILYRGNSYGAHDGENILVSCKRTGRTPVSIDEFAAGNMCLTCRYRTGLMPDIDLDLKSKLLAEGIDICNMAFPERERHSAYTWRYTEEMSVIVPSGCPHATVNEVLMPKSFGTRLFPVGRTYKTIMANLPDDMSIARYEIRNAPISKSITPAAWRVVVDDDKVMMTIRYNSRFVDLGKGNNVTEAFYKNFVLNVETGRSHISDIHNNKKSLKNSDKKKMPVLIDTTYNMPNVDVDMYNEFGILAQKLNYEFIKAFTDKLAEKFGKKVLESIDVNPYIPRDSYSVIELFDSLSSINRFPFLDFPVVREEWDRLPVRVRRRIGKLPRDITEKQFIETFSNNINVPNEFIDWGTYHFRDKQHLAQNLIFASEAGVQSNSDKDLIDQSDEILNYIRGLDDSRRSAYALREPLDILTFVVPAFCSSTSDGVTRKLSDTTRKLAVDITKTIASRGSFKLNEEFVSELLREGISPLDVVGRYKRNLLEFSPRPDKSFDFVVLPQKFYRGGYEWVFREATGPEVMHHKHSSSQYSTGLGTFIAIDKVDVKTSKILKTVFMIYKSRFSIDGRRWTLAQRKSLRSISDRILQIINSSVIPGSLDKDSREELAGLLEKFDTKCELFASCGKQYEIYVSYIDDNLQDEFVMDKFFPSVFTGFLYKNHFGINKYACKNKIVLTDIKTRLLRKEQKKNTSKNSK